MRATVIHGAGDVRVETVLDQPDGYAATNGRTALKVLVTP